MKLNLGVKLLIALLLPLSVTTAQTKKGDYSNVETPKRLVSHTEALALASRLIFNEFNIEKLNEFIIEKDTNGELNLKFKGERAGKSYYTHCLYSYLKAEVGMCSSTIDYNGQQFSETSQQIVDLRKKDSSGKSVDLNNEELLTLIKKIRPNLVEKFKNSELYKNIEVKIAAFFSSVDTNTVETYVIFKNKTINTSRVPIVALGKIASKAYSEEDSETPRFTISGNDLLLKALDNVSNTAWMNNKIIVNSKAGDLTDADYTPSDYDFIFSCKGSLFENEEDKVNTKNLAKAYNKRKNVYIGNRNMSCELILKSI